LPLLIRRAIGLKTGGINLFLSRGTSGTKWDKRDKWDKNNCKSTSYTIKLGQVGTNGTRKFEFYIYFSNVN
jgi:hypothetical protein